MSKFIEGLKSLFTGPDTSAQEAAARKAREDQQLQIAQQRSELQRERAEQDAALAGSIRPRRGRRLLMAATGEQGVKKVLG